MMSPINSSLRKMSDTQSRSMKRDCEIFTNYINKTLSNVPSLKEYLPIPSSDDIENHPLFDKIRDGVILAHLIQQVQPSSIQISRMVINLDLDQMDQMHSKVTFQVNANLNMVIAAAKSIPELVVVNLGAEDFLNKKKDLILGILWQLINCKLSSKLSLLAHPELVLLVKDGESLASLASMKAEKILLRWLNYHLKGENITNFGDDINVNLYLKLIRKIAPLLPNEDVKLIESSLLLGDDNKENEREKMNLLIKLSNYLNCNDGYFSEHQGGELSCSKINYAFLCTLFNNHIGLKIPTQKEFDLLSEEISLMQDKMSNLKIETNNSILEKEKKENEMKEEVEKLYERISELQREKVIIQEEVIERMKKENQQSMERIKEEIGEELDIMEKERELYNIQKEKIEQSLRSEILSIISSMAENLSIEELEEGNLLDIKKLDSSTNDSHSLLRTMSLLSNALLEKMKEERSISANLRISLEERDRLNQLMSERVKKCNGKILSAASSPKSSDDQEQVIPNSIDSRRGSLLKRVFGTD